MRLRRFLVSVVLLAFGLRALTVFLGPGSPELHVAGLGWFVEDAPVLRRQPTRMKGS